MFIVVYLVMARKQDHKSLNDRKVLYLITILKYPYLMGPRRYLIKFKDKGVLSTKLIGECAVPMVEVAAHGDIGLQRWFRLVGAGGSVGGEERVK